MDIERLRLWVQDGKWNDAAKEVLSSQREILLITLKKLGWYNGAEEEIMHDAIIDFLSALNTGKKIDSPRSYIIGIAKLKGANRKRKKDFKFLNQAKRQDEKEALEYVQTMYQVSGLSATYQDTTPRIEFLYEQLYNGISHLNEKCKKHIKLKYLDGWSHREIAKALPHLDKPTSSATLLNRCLKKLRDLIGEKESTFYI